MIKDPEGDKWRANKIILCEKYLLSDPETYTKLNIPIMDVASAIINGLVSILGVSQKFRLRI